MKKTKKKSILTRKQSIKVQEIIREIIIKKINAK